MDGVTTIVFLHAHPDDESSGTSGSMARAAKEGHRVVVVYGTNGDHGEVPDDLAPGETLVDRRHTEAEASARVTGTQRVEWLGYVDSGMTGWEQNDAPGSFHRADVDEAARRLVAVLDDEDADVLVGYDWHGGYGHPDHVKVHHVAHRAAELAARRPRMLEVTMNRDRMRIWADAMKAAGEEAFDPDGPMDDGNPMGTPEAEIHWQVDVSEFIEQRRASMQAHASQVTDIGMFMAMPREMFDAAFGAEFYIEPGRPAGMVEGWFLDG
ncbi:PIG-L family deacetylase [Luteipulveratus sp. YIM 133132]|uniref:PIG-L family deacetylase n=1 Tax=Luteipulveratus flavus TaxID=3031728 RepID=A0ABT6CAX1_9MICO|nr:MULTISPECIES: PIG-L family deacetylase [unclassified Luteipulveratus]MDE9365458.1 PIG-L family deacetylase [Luteipulveratus sp. YIM 133132]MDF8266024.1 PIG-L family deacetylase [Luteipulveratus sp. YIM 133296]